MKIFISWSGKRSKYIAEQLRDWLPKVLQFTKPWCSSEDIPVGSFWNEKVRENLKHSQFAIICLTKENIHSPWINYEAGAIAERLGGNVCPYLFEISPHDLRNSPLHRLQAATTTSYEMVTNKEETLRLLKAINTVAGCSGLEDSILASVFAVLWQELEKALSDVNKLELGFREITVVKERLKELLQEYRIEGSRINNLLKEFDGSLMDIYHSNLLAADWVKMQNENWSEEAVNFLNENRISFELGECVDRVELKQDISNCLKWIELSLKEGTYQKMDIIPPPSIQHPFPYLKALRFLKGKRMNGLGNEQAINDIREVIDTLMTTIEKNGK